jgi:mitotic spindle assembly checkpoint protein MAD2
MSSSAQDTVVSNVINLKGSTEIVKEFFNYSVNNILYQRGIYPPESFKRISQYGLAMMVTTDESLLSYMNNILRQLEGNVVSFLSSCQTFNSFYCERQNVNVFNPFVAVWLMNGSVQKLILVIKGTESGETLERWVFDCECKHKENER